MVPTIKLDKHIMISDSNKLLFEAQITINQQDNIFRLDLLSDEIRLTNIEGYDFFDCLNKVRQVIEPNGFLILCQGTVINVYPSRMSRDMSDGLKAYSFQIGKKLHLIKLLRSSTLHQFRLLALYLSRKHFLKNGVQAPNIDG